jgi:hypothetical protein
MTTLEQLRFAAQIQVGTQIKGYGGQIMIVTEIGKKYITGYDKYCFEKYGKISKTFLSYDTIMNPHYNNNLSII